MNSNKTISPITLRDNIVVPIDKLRTYAELIIPKIQLYFKEYEPEDEFKIFFERNKRQDRRRIDTFRAVLITSIHTVFGKNAMMSDLALIFHFKNYDGVYRVIESRARRDTRFELLRKEMEEDLMELNQDQYSTVNNYVLISGVIDKKPWERYVHKQQLAFADKLFEAILQDEALGLTREEVVSSIKDRKHVLARTIFIHVFLRKYPNTTEIFLAYILNKKNDSSITRTIIGLRDYFNPAISKLDYVIEFHEIVARIKTRCEAERP